MLLYNIREPKRSRNSAQLQHAVCASSVRPGELRSSKWSDSIGVLRRLLSILLVIVIGLPLAAPIFAATLRSESSLPACCRRAGKHHCMGEIQKDSGASSKTVLRSSREICPYMPTLPAAFHSETSGAPTRMMVVDVLLMHDAVLAQTESKLRISRTRSRQKRGPPTLSAS